MQHRMNERVSHIYQYGYTTYRSARRIMLDNMAVVISKIGRHRPVRVRASQRATPRVRYAALRQRKNYTYIYVLLQDI